MAPGLPAQVIDQLAYASNIDGDWDIFTMDANGTNLRQLTFNTANDYRPTWSPDGTRLAFQSDRDGDFDIYVMNADGTNVQQLTFNTVPDVHPCWSPDGTRIAYQSSLDGDREIFAVSPTTWNVLQLTVNVAGDWFPYYSPDGTQITFYSDRDGDRDIYIMNADGTNVRQVTFNIADDRYPVWSADGARIAFASDQDGDFDIYAVGTNGYNLVRLTDTFSTDWAPNWSPDGTRVAFASERDGDNELYIMNADGTGLRQLTFNAANDEVPVWQPRQVPAPIPTPSATLYPTPSAGLDWTLAPLYGQATLADSFYPDPYMILVNSGGPMDVSFLASSVTNGTGSMCMGTTTRQPTLRLNWTGQGSLPVILAVDGSATMVVRGPDGGWNCLSSGAARVMCLSNVFIQAGEYNIWIADPAGAADPDHAGRHAEIRERLQHALRADVPVTFWYECPGRRCVTGPCPF